MLFYISLPSWPNINTLWRLRNIFCLYSRSPSPKVWPPTAQQCQEVKLCGMSNALLIPLLYGAAHIYVCGFRNLKNLKLITPSSTLLMNVNTKTQTYLPLYPLQIWSLHCTSYPWLTHVRSTDPYGRQNDNMPVAWIKNLRLSLRIKDQSNPCPFQSTYIVVTAHSVMHVRFCNAVR
jgi:hypothetical protein